MSGDTNMGDVAKKVTAIGDVLFLKEFRNVP